MSTGSFPGVNCARGVLLTTHPLLVTWSRKSRAIPLLPLCAVRPVQNLSACTTVHFTFTYTSTPPMCRTACPEPQCLYNGALYIYLTTINMRVNEFGSNGCFRHRNNEYVTLLWSLYTLYPTCYKNEKSYDLKFMT